MTAFVPRERRDIPSAFMVKKSTIDESSGCLLYRGESRKAEDLLVRVPDDGDGRCGNRL